MGNYVSSGNEQLKRSNVKLQAQQVTPFNGNAIKWHAWKKKTRAAIGVAGMLRILDNENYSQKHPVDNETVFHLFQVATADGSAAHLVDKHNDGRNGFAAYEELVKWYEGDQLTSETAEDVRSKLDRLVLTTKNSASQYINEFQQHIKHLEELGEEYTESKTVNIFLTQITDPDYQNTKEACLENKYDIETCIERMRSKERRLTRDRSERRKSNIVVRRNEHEGSNNQVKYLNLGDYKNNNGFYSIPSDIWFELSNEDKAHVKRHNGKLKREHGRDSSPQDTKRQRTAGSFTSRRSRSEGEENMEGDIVEEQPSNKTVTFKDKEDSSVDKTTNEILLDKDITSRRGALRFKLKND